MKDLSDLAAFAREHENSIVIIFSIVSMTFLGSLLLTATGKVLEVTANEIVETTMEPDGTEVRQTNNDRKVRFYSE